MTEKRDNVLENILAKLDIEKGNIYIKYIRKNENMYLIQFSDVYGNDIDEVPLGFNITSGENVQIDLSIPITGCFCEIPRRYMTYRDIVCEKLAETIPSFIKDEIGPWVVKSAINVMYSEYISNVSISQLYAICNYMVYSIALTCNEKEKGVIDSLLSNNTIYNFIKTPILEKLNIIDSCFYYHPNYLREVISLSNELLSISVEKKLGKEIDSDYCETLIKKITKNLIEVKEKLLKDTDYFCDCVMLNIILDNLIENFEIESKYCRGLSDNITERMKDLTDISLLGYRKFFVDYYLNTPNFI